MQQGQYGGPGEKDGRDHRGHAQGVLCPGQQRWPTHLLDGGSEGAQDGRSTPTVSLHPWHGGLGMAHMGEMGEWMLTSQQQGPDLPRLAQTHRGPHGVP